MSHEAEIYFEIGIKIEVSLIFQFCEFKFCRKIVKVNRKGYIKTEKFRTW